MSTKVDPNVYPYMLIAGFSSVLSSTVALFAIHRNAPWASAIVLLGLSCSTISVALPITSHVYFRATASNGTRQVEIFISRLRHAVRSGRLEGPDLIAAIHALPRSGEGALIAPKTRKRPSRAISDADVRGRAERAAQSRYPSVTEPATEPETSAKAHHEIYRMLSEFAGLIPRGAQRHGRDAETD